MKIEFYIGAGRDRDDKPIAMEEAWAIRAKLEAKLTEAFGGWTQHPGCIGEWEGIKEPAYRFDVLTSLDIDAKVPWYPIVTKISAELRDIARQTCIAVNVVKSDVMFV